MVADGGFGGGVARGGGSNAKEEGGEELGRDAWSSLAAGGGLQAIPQWRAAAPLSAGGVEQRKQVGRLEEGENELICNFRNFRDPIVNQQ